MLRIILLATLPSLTFATTSPADDEFCQHSKTVIQHLRSCTDKQSCSRACKIIGGQSDLERIGNSNAYVYSGLPIFDFCSAFDSMHTPEMYGRIADTVEKEYNDKCKAKTSPSDQQQGRKKRLRKKR